MLALSKTSPAITGRCFYQIVTLNAFYKKAVSDPWRLKITYKKTSLKLIGRENDKYNRTIFDSIDTENAAAAQEDEDIF